jgi:hypothetical protein
VDSERDPELLTGGERQYLERLSLRRATEVALDDDKVFYEHTAMSCARIAD